MRQDDFRLKASGRPFKEYGCAIMSCFFWAEQVGGQTLSPVYVIDKVEEWLIKRWIGSTLYINEWEKIMRDLGIPCKYKGHIPADMPCLPNEIEILNVTFGKFSHFLPGDGRGNFVFDPLGRNKRQRLYIIKSKRVFELEN